MFCAARISPPLESARSPCAAARPLPRSTSEKHFDLDTYTLISASGDSRLYCSHQWFSGSVTARVPIFLSQVGISGCGASARAATAAHTRTRVNAAGTALFALWCNTDRPSRMDLFLFTKVIRVPRQCKPNLPPRGTELRGGSEGRRDRALQPRVVASRKRPEPLSVFERQLAGRPMAAAFGCAASCVQFNRKAPCKPPQRKPH